MATDHSSAAVRPASIPSIQGGLSMLRRLLRRLSIPVVAAILGIISVSSVSAQWPTTCVELNDIVEAHLGNTQNVGIYQRAFGLGAEEACRRDHGDDVRSVFAWAALVVTQAPVSDISRETNWIYGARYDAIDSHYLNTASVHTEGESKIQAQCNVTTVRSALFIEFGGYTYLSTKYGSNSIDVEWRINDGAPVAQQWTVGDDGSTIWVPQNQIDDLARQLVHARRFVVRATDSGGDQETVEFSLSGAGSPNHPVAYVLRSCGRNV